MDSVFIRFVLWWLLTTLVNLLLMVTVKITVAANNVCCKPLPCVLWREASRLGALPSAGVTSAAPVWAAAAWSCVVLPASAAALALPGLPALPPARFDPKYQKKNKQTNNHEQYFYVGRCVLPKTFMLTETTVNYRNGVNYGSQNFKIFSYTCKHLSWDEWRCFRHLTKLCRHWIPHCCLSAQANSDVTRKPLTADKSWMA